MFWLCIKDYDGSRKERLVRSGDFVGVASLDALRARVENANERFRAMAIVLAHQPKANETVNIFNCAATFGWNGFSGSGKQVHKSQWFINPNKGFWEDLDWKW